MFHRCDVIDEGLGKCKNLAYREGYFRKGRKHWWGYLCRKHFDEMKGKDKRMQGWCSID